MLTVILIKFCGFLVYLEPNSMILSAFPGKFTEAEKKILTFCVTVASPNLAPKFEIYGPHADISNWSFRFRPTLKIKGISHKKKNFK